jgi:hypothetical protein
VLFLAVGEADASVDEELVVFLVLEVFVPDFLVVDVP